jgi:ubiquinone/menaquinone biosynthesis C-methylase UbiE
MVSSIIKSISKIFNEFSNSGKILIFVILLLILFMLFRKNKEGFETTDTFQFVDGANIYDNFYSSIYDYLVYNNVKDNYEIGEIINSTNPTSQSIVLDIGSGTGHDVDLFNKKGIKAVGLDNSTAMINKARELYPQYNFIKGDVVNANNFEEESFTHITCLYFTIYYIKDKTAFFNNCFHWLKSGGYLIVHLVNKDMFDPILPPANPLLMVSPQRYAKERITTSNIKFDNFNYQSNFILNGDTASFIEKFKNKDTDKTFRRQEHLLYMDNEEKILAMAQNCGFVLYGKIDLIKIAYEYQYLYIFLKP